MEGLQLFVDVHCQITRSGFPSERVFRIQQSDNNEYVGAAPVEYFLSEKRQEIEPDEPRSDKSINGFVKARIVAEQNGSSAVHVPSGDVVWIDKNQIN